MDDVFEARIASLRSTTSSSALNVWRFSSACSGTASTTRSRSPSAAVSVTTLRRPSAASASSSVSLARFVALAIDVSMRWRPNFAVSSSTSTTTTSHPARAATLGDPGPHEAAADDPDPIVMHEPTISDRSHTSASRRGRYLYRRASTSLRRHRGSSPSMGGARTRRAGPDGGRNLDDPGQPDPRDRGRPGLASLRPHVRALTRCSCCSASPGVGRCP